MLILVALAILVYFIGCWGVPAVLWKRFGTAGKLIGAITMIAFPLYLVVVTIGFASDQEACLVQDVANETDICDSPTDAIIYGLGFILAPCAIILTSLSFLIHKKKQMVPNI
jgi:Na+(H+)/acetate symporter ActP